MSRLWIVGVAAGLLLGLVLLWPREPSPADTYLAFQRADIQAGADRESAARWSAFYDAALPLGGLLVGATLVGGLIFVGMALWARRRPLVDLPALGIPVDRDALHRGAYAQLPFALVEASVQKAIAAGPQVPHALTLHTAYRNDGPGAQPAQLAPPVFQPPSIGEAAERGAFRDGHYILGYTLTEGRPLTLEQRDGRSLLIAGQGGSGGTTYLLGSALQEILMPFYLPGQAEAARFLLVDYHAHKPGSLTQRAAGLGERVIYAAHTPAEVERAAAMFQAECRARIAGKRAAWPLVLLCDEVGNMVDDGDYSDVIKPLLKTFTFANNAARAVGGKAIVRGHTLQASAWGNTAAVRQSFHARAGMRLDADAAGLLGIRPALAREMIALPAGRAFVTGPGLSLTEAVASNVRGDDVGRVLDLAGYRANARTVHAVDLNLDQRGADLLENSPKSSDPDPTLDQAADDDRGLLLQGDWWAAIVPPEGKSTEADSTPESAVADNPADKMADNPAGNPMAVRLYCLFMAGRSLPECIFELYGVSSQTGGRRYTAAMQDAQALLRAEIARRRANPTEGIAI